MLNKAQGSTRAQERFQDVHRGLVGNLETKVLWVEGVDDVLALESLLETGQASGAWGTLPVNKTWRSLWTVQAAGSKSLALELAKIESEAKTGGLALVDRDEWSAASISQLRRSQSNVVILPRFCIESYLVDPNELWQALPAKIKGNASAADISQSVLANLAVWARHAAIWWVVNPLWQGLRNLGFNTLLLGTSMVPNNSQLMAVLQEWSAYMDPNEIFGKIQVAESRTMKMVQRRPDLFLRRYLYAKKFFPEVVCPALGFLSGQRNVAYWRTMLFKTMPIPADLDSLWKQMGLKSAVMALAPAPSP